MSAVETQIKETLPAKAVAPVDNQPVEAFRSSAGFATALKMARAMSESTLVPKDYIGNIPNCLIVLEMSARIGCSPLMAAQNLDIIHGRPSWRSTFIIASINACGRFSPLRYKVTGEGMNRACIAWVTEKETGERLEGPEVSIAMAKAEGWYDRNGSKWKTLPDLMLRYRAAAFFGRLYAPELLLGMQTAEEVVDVVDVTPRSDEPTRGVAGAKSLLADVPASAPAASVIEREPGSDDE
jgi:hypothetical protein